MEKDIEKFVSEFLATHGGQALSDDMVEQVVGGELAGLYLNGTFVEKEMVYNLFLNMTDLYGYRTAANVFCEATGFNKNEIIATRSGNSTDKENMYQLITQCLTTFDKIQNGGSTY